MVVPSVWIARMRRSSQPDREWARLAGVDTWTVWAWRRSVGLPSHQHRVRVRAVREMRRDPAALDTEVARVVGVTERTVWRWRREAGLPPALDARRARDAADRLDRVEALASDWSTVTALCERSGLSVGPVRRAVYALRDAGRLAVRPKPVGTGWEYRAVRAVPRA